MHPQKERAKLGLMVKEDNTTLNLDQWPTQIKHSYWCSKMLDVVSRSEAEPVMSSTNVIDSCEYLLSRGILGYLLRILPVPPSAN
jgi:hypothetical protein